MVAFVCLSVAFEPKMEDHRNFKFCKDIPSRARDTPISGRKVKSRSSRSHKSATHYYWKRTRSVTAGFFLRLVKWCLQLRFDCDSTAIRRATTIRRPTSCLRRPARLASSSCGRHKYSRCTRQTSSDRHQTSDRIIA